MTDEIEAWIGRPRTQLAMLEPELAVRYAAAMGASLDVAADFPPLGHWAYFNDAVAPAELGPDGHPRRGLFLPPIALPRRMFASSVLRFESPLDAGRAGRARPRPIADIRRRSGRQSGELMLVDQRRELTQDGALRLTETQTIVYREAGEPTPAVVDTGAGGEGELWRPTAVDLFRYSAATYNGHRIHYDQAYVARRGRLSGPRGPRPVHRRQAVRPGGPNGRRAAADVQLPRARAALREPADPAARRRRPEHGDRRPLRRPDRHERGLSRS